MKIIYSILCLTFCLGLQAQGLVIDKRAIRQVGANSVSAIAKEKLIQNSFSKARDSQEAVNKYTSLVLLNMSMIEKSQQDISAFKEGGKNIVILSKYLVACGEELRRLSTDIYRYPLGTLAYSKQITSISLHLVDIGSQVVSIVTDGQVKADGIPDAPKVSNLIDPIKRLEIINQCIYELQRVYSLIRDIRINIQMRNTMRDAALALAPTATLSADLLTEIKNDVIRLWQD